MQCKAINQEVDDPGLSRSSHVHHLFQKGLALNPPLGILPGVCKFNIIQPYGCLLYTSDAADER